MANNGTSSGQVAEIAAAKLPGSQPNINHPDAMETLAAWYNRFWPMIGRGQPLPLQQQQPLAQRQQTSAQRQQTQVQEHQALTPQQQTSPGQQSSALLIITTSSGIDSTTCSTNSHNHISNTYTTSTLHSNIGMCSDSGTSTHTTNTLPNNITTPRINESSYPASPLSFAPIAPSPPAMQYPFIPGQYVSPIPLSVPLIQYGQPVFSQQYSQPFLFNQYGQHLLTNQHTLPPPAEHYAHPVAAAQPGHNDNETLLTSIKAMLDKDKKKSSKEQGGKEEKKKQRTCWKCGGPYPFRGAFQPGHSDQDKLLTLMKAMLDKDKKGNNKEQGGEKGKAKQRTCWKCGGPYPYRGETNEKASGRGKERRGGGKKKGRDSKQ